MKVPAYVLSLPFAALLVARLAEEPMGKKRPKTKVGDQLDKLLKTRALQRLEQGSPSPAKPKKPKRSTRR